MWTPAPAKINWTLEVLGRRDDGYHEVRTVLQTIELYDELTVAPSDGFSYAVDGRESPYGERDLVLRAARLLAERAGRRATGRIELRKRVPAGAGLGGGSSDAAAALRCLARLWDVDIPLQDVAAELGSDVAFFLHGGTGLAEGRGERVTPLPDAPGGWLVLLVPPLVLEGKTAAMYSRLVSGDYTDGGATARLADALSAGTAVPEEALVNVFERAAYEAFPALSAFRESLLGAGAQAVHLCGSGPALFVLASGEAEARAVRRRLPRLGGRTFVARTMTATEATAVSE